MLDDAKQRWQAQVIGDVLPLEFRDPEAAIVEDDRHDPRCAEAGNDGGA